MTIDPGFSGMKRLGRLLLIVVFLIALGVSVGFAQDSAAQQIAPPASTAAAPLPADDVMSIKLDKGTSDSVSIRTKDGRFSATNVSLKQLLEGVFYVKQDLITGLSGPIASARFDIEAKVVEPDLGALAKLTSDQRWAMLRPLLVDRFQLQTHTQSKILPIYELTVLPGGPKFKPSASQTDPGGGSTSIHGNSNRFALTGQGIPMMSLAKTLAGQAHRTTADKTGLSGNFDVKLQWSTDDNPDPAGEKLPSLFTALEEQLGLKLQPSKGPVETLVVDHAEMPSEN
jgi:uncharacterized protein (TIGR03435 family)